MRRAAALILFLVLLPVLAAALPVYATQAANPPSYSEVLNAYYAAKTYIENLERVAYDTTTWRIADKVVAEYPSIPVWGKLGDYLWVPAIKFEKECMAGLTLVTMVSLSTQEIRGSTYTMWVHDYTFRAVYVTIRGASTFDVAKIRVVEKHESSGNGYFDITVSTVSYGSAPAMGSCSGIDGSQIAVYIGPVYAGTVGELASSPYSMTRSLPIPSFRFSARHVLAMADAFYYAIGQSDLHLHGTLVDILEAVWQEPTAPYDLYAAALAYYNIPFDVKPVDANQFYDAKVFYYPPPAQGFETGYDRMFRLFLERGYIHGQGTIYPLYPYKSKLVSAAEKSGKDGGSLFLNLLDHACALEDDPLLNAWRGLYYAATGQWGLALSEWYNIVDDWNGVGIEVCYSDNYSGLRLATAIMLGTLLADRGYIGWGIVDEMVRALLKTQWKGQGYYKPENSNTWVYIYKWDHRGGFLVGYNVAPDGSFGSTGFRPDYLELIVEGNDMDPEYLGPLPTNAETTLAALIALKLYMDSRY